MGGNKSGRSVWSAGITVRSIATCSRTAQDSDTRHRAIHHRANRRSADHGSNTHRPVPLLLATRYVQIYNIAVAFLNATLRRMLLQVFRRFPASQKVARLFAASAPRSESPLSRLRRFGLSSFAWCLAMPLAIFPSAVLSAAEPTLGEIRAARETLRRASQLYGNGEYDQAGEVVDGLLKQIKPWQIPTDRRLAQQYTALRRGIQRARKALREKNVSLPGRSRRRSPKSASAMEEPTDTPMVDDDDRVSFARQLAPIMVERCLECHNAGDRSGGLSLASYGRLARGGNRGAPLEGASAAESLLVRKLKGTAEGEQMPPDGPLTDTQIALFAAWVAQGGTNDAGSDRAELTEIASELKLATATAEELNTERREQAAQNWRLAFPSSEAETIETANFLVVGGEDPNRLRQVGETAEQIRERIVTTLHVDDSQFATKGRTTVFVVPRVFDINEFALMVEGRNLPRPVRHAFWTVQGADCYVVVRLASEDPPDRVPLTRALTGAMLETRGGYPRWFINGTADLVQAKLHPRSRETQRLEDSLGVLASLKQPTDILRERTSVDVVAAGGYQLVKSLQQNERQFADLLVSVDRKAPFDAAVEKSFNRPLKQLVEQWWEIGGGGTKRRRR